MYAVTMKNVLITAGFAIITLSQLSLGTVMVALAAKMGGKVRLLDRRKHSQTSSVVQTQPEIPLDAYHLCVFVQPKSFEIAYASLSLTYGTCKFPLAYSSDNDTTYTSDFLAFAFIVFYTRRSKVPGVKVRTILDTIAEDATRYFLVIFTSHFVFVMTLNLGRVSPTNRFPLRILERWYSPRVSLDND
jgi:hypothetical protein